MVGAFSDPLFRFQPIGFSRSIGASSLLPKLVGEFGNVNPRRIIRKLRCRNRS